MSQIALDNHTGRYTVSNRGHEHLSLGMVAWHDTWRGRYSLHWLDQRGNGLSIEQRSQPNCDNAKRVWQI